jgi:hypothetical protein
MNTFRRFLEKRQKNKEAGAAPAASTPDPAPATVPTPENGNAIVEKRVANDQQQILAEAAPSGTLQVALQNKSNSSNVYAYITGLAINKNNAPLFVQSDGRTIYYVGHAQLPMPRKIILTLQPNSPSQTQSALQADVAIPLGAPGNTVNAYIPKIAGGRIWFSIDSKLTFKLNPGPAVVEPSVTNTSDPNYNINWTFCEFTYNDAQLFANISYVDFVSIPVALSLTGSDNSTQTVPGWVV